MQFQALLDAFAHSPGNASNRYEGKLLEVSGTICGISDELNFITLNGSQPDPFRKVQCRFEKDQSLNALSIGQDISIRGALRWNDSKCHSGRLRRRSDNRWKAPMLKPQ